MSATIVYCEAFSDGSGLPATILADGIKWGFDFIGGEVRCRQIGAAKVNRRTFEHSKGAATAVYKRLVGEQGAEWARLNAEMYAA